MKSLNPFGGPKSLFTAFFAMALMGAIAFAADKPAARQAKPARKPDAALEQIQDDPNLPRVMLIGDSISMGYTPVVREMLKGKFNVHQPPTNCGDTTHGVAQLDSWLGDGKWAVIHFNFGLHDLKYVDEKGTMVDIDKGKQNLSLERYEANLRKIVERLKKTGAKLIWAATTPVPDGSKGRVKGDELKYNEVAAKVMSENGIPTDDLHAVVIAKPELQLPKNVHFTKEGSQELAKTVIGSIDKALAEK